MKAKKYHTWDKRKPAPTNPKGWHYCPFCGLYRLQTGTRQFVFSFDRKQLELSRPDCLRQPLMGNELLPTVYL
jgi:hypothetical protein